MTGAPTRMHSSSPSRRRALRRLFALAAAQGSALPVLSACGGGGAGNDPIVVGNPPAPVPTPPPAPAPPVAPPVPVDDAVARLKAAIASTAPTIGTTSVTITQGAAQSVTSSFGDGAQFFPPLPQSSSSNLATIAQVYGRRRDLWTQLGGGVIASQQVVPVALDHVASTESSSSRTGLHFVHDGAAFEVLVGGVPIGVTLIVDGVYVGTDALTPMNSAQGTPFAQPNTLMKFDFGAAAQRNVSLYMISSRGPCAIVIGAGDTIAPIDLSAKASFAAMADSYGGAYSDVWGIGGLFYEASTQLGIPHADLDAIGGTGYAANNGSAASLDAGNAFVARLGSIVTGLPDLFVTAGSINDNNRLALPPYASASAAQAGFAAAVSTYFTNLRAALPTSVLAAIGPWQPPPNLPASQGELDKATVIKQALQTAGGHWVFVDNINGGWANSAGAAGTPSTTDGPWQTTQNAATYLGADQIHPNDVGCVYLGTRLANSLRAGIQAL